MNDDDRKLCLNGCFTIKPRSEFGRHPRTPDGLASRCKACEVERIQLSKHGITAAQKAEIAAAQGGCAICHRPEPSKKGWVVDHDHACCPGARSCANCRRGVLCGWCNAALGYAQDSPEILRAAADYLESGVRLDTSRFTDSLYRDTEANRSTSPTYETRRDGLTQKASHLPEITPSYVTRTRTYRISIGDQP